jgi:hypothetical protein
VGNGGGKGAELVDGKNNDEVGDERVKDLCAHGGRRAEEQGGVYACSICVGECVGPSRRVSEHMPLWFYKCVPLSFSARAVHSVSPMTR